jgi:hypothetical protein
MTQNYNVVPLVATDIQLLLDATTATGQNGPLTLKFGIPISIPASIRLKINFPIYFDNAVVSSAWYAPVRGYTGSKTMGTYNLDISSIVGRVITTNASQLEIGNLYNSTAGTLTA